MRVSISMGSDDEINVAGWWAKSPDCLVNALRQQLEAATAIWPELKDYKIEKRRSRRSVAA
jgi:hypothetical protein